MTLAPPAPPTRATAGTTPPRHPSTLGVPATAGQRAGAYLIDIAVVAVVATLVWLFTGGSLLLVAVAVIELWAIGWVWEGHTGATPGNLACGIRTVQKGADVSIGARGLFLRSLVLGLAHIIPVLLPVGLSASGLLDGLAHARVIDVRKTRRARADEPSFAPDLEARIVGGDATAATPGAPGVITQTPLTPPPAIAVEPVPVDAGSIPVFELSDGTVIQATGLGYIGRAPRAPETIPDAILIRVPDGSRSLSRTHAAFGVEEGQLWVQDLGSANGAAVRHLGGSMSDLVAHHPYFLVPGDVLVLGNDAELAFRRVAGRGGRSAGSTAAVADAAAPAIAAATPPVVQQAAPVVQAAPGVQAAPSTQAAVPAAQAAAPAVHATPAVQQAAPTVQQAAPVVQAAPAAQAAAAAPAPIPAAAPPTPAAAAQAAPPTEQAAQAAPPAEQAAQAAPPATRAQRAAQAAAPAPAVAPVSAVALQFADGTTIPIRGLGYIGRAPRLPEGEHPDAALIPVPDGDRSVSRTHGRFGIVDGQTWFEDLGSGNGSSLRTADGRSGPMTPHQRFVLAPGLTLQLGDCVIRVITV